MITDRLERRVALPEGFIERLSRAWPPVFAELPEIVAAYLFGSAARGGPAADLDVGYVLRDRPLTLGERGRLAGRLEDTAGVAAPVDLRELTDEEPIFSMAVIRDGVPLYEGDHRRRVAFEASVFSRFQDFWPVMERIRAQIRDKCRGR